MSDSNPTRLLWVISLVRFEERADADPDSWVAPRLQAELVEVTASDDPMQLMHDVELAAFVRGGQPLALLEPVDEPRIPQTMAELQVALALSGAE